MALALSIYASATGAAAPGAPQSRAYLPGRRARPDGPADEVDVWDVFELDILPGRALDVLTKHLPVHGGEIRTINVIIRNQSGSV